MAVLTRGGSVCEVGRFDEKGLVLVVLGLVLVVVTLFVVVLVMAVVETWSCLK